MNYNGEIYNFRELRIELSSLGHRFVSRSDSEVLLNALIEWGTGALNRLNGMFAFALSDKRERNLLLARDRYGVKPLYWTYQGGTFLFGSEIKALLAHPMLHVEVDREALIEYFTFQNFFTDRTLFRGIRLMPPGTFMRVQRSAPAEPQCYWDFDFAEPAEPLSKEEYEEELSRLFRQAVNRQLVSDVDVGAYLSGGIDSGSITAVAASQIPYMKSFTTGFDLHSASGVELAFDEREQAERMSYFFKTEHYEMVLKAETWSGLCRASLIILRNHALVRATQISYAAQLAAKFVKVVLAGTGSDELFGGYPWRYYRAVVNDDFEHYIDKYYLFWHRLIPNRYIQKMFEPIWSDVKHVWTRDIFRNVFADHASSLTKPEDYINHSLYFEAKTFLHGLLVVEDKLSMAHGFNRVCLSLIMIWLISR